MKRAFEIAIRGAVWLFFLIGVFTVAFWCLIVFR
jgi:hypothetical protein